MPRAASWFALCLLASPALAGDDISANTLSCLAGADGCVRGVGITSEILIQSGAREIVLIGHGGSLCGPATVYDYNGAVLLALPKGECVPQKPK